MIDLIRLGDTTDHGGEVTCPLHPEVVPNVIVEGDDRITDHGVPVARQGHHATCGCSLISSVV
ncbi:PAAR domain-containing protein [Paraburkholderia sp. BL17N1]|uniref:PAAR domain-containing protein n=1 Tax=Paraburkholderia sp. BL17N1 TaxID=1938798 RepID=UPI000EADDBB6|nr:PAAR domain-containing protein [Paraburkholderia sp. BL17N1]